MCCSLAFRALLGRNLLYRRRNLFGTFFEIALPVGFICILLGIKIALEDSDSFKPETIPALFPGDTFEYTSEFPIPGAIIPLSFRDYVTSLQVKRICEKSVIDANQWEFQISGYYDNQNPFLKCDRRSCDFVGQNASNFCERLILAVAPTESTALRGLARAEAFAGFVNSTYPELVTSVPMDYPFVQVFGSDAEIADYVKSPNYGTTGFPKVALAVTFGDGSSERDYAYTLRVNSTNYNQPEQEGRPAQSTTPNTKRQFSYYSSIDNVCEPVGGTPDQGPLQNSCTGQYLYNGAITIQRLVQDWILVDSGAAAAGMSVAEHGVQFVQFPQAAYTINGFYASINDFAPLLIVLGLLYPVAAVIRSITLEKQLRQKELMKMMAVSESAIGWSWFTSYFLFHFVTAVLSAIASANLYTKSQPLILFVFWLLGYTSIITFSLAISSIFTKSTLATLVGLIVTFAGYFLTLAVNFQTGTLGLIFLISLHPIGAIAFGMQEIGRLEDAQVGATSTTIGSTDSPSGYTFSTSLRCLFVATVLWGIVSWYLNRIVRSDFGQPLPWNFPFSLNYWCPGRFARTVSHEDDHTAESYDVPVEEVGDALHANIKEGKGIAIRGLRKKFGDKIAVDGLSLSMYPGQVTALLGHNGAGKTTTINMLTGMYKPTDGYAVVAGKDIRYQMNEIRREIGICLQHDCLFPQLTVQEHVAFFSRLKGVFADYPWDVALQKVKQSIEDVALYEKRNTFARNLSGGMKRKLSVAIAFCGDSKTVLLDEPTSGMDPFSRRFTWNVIRQYRQDRTIILTTHFMDEADVLGDRIAIMAEGHLRCAGSSLFLKKQYGVGYHLTIEKKPVKSSRDEKGPLSNADHMDDRITDIVTSRVAEAGVLSNVGTEMTFQLPIGASSNFTPMFEDLDKEVDDGNIVTYGVSITTLDEVFLLVARGGTGEKVEMKSSRAGLGGATPMDDEKSYRSRMDLEKEGLFPRHVKSLFRKRALNFKRDKKAWFCSTILPSIMVLIGFILFKFVTPQRNMSSLTLSLVSFNPTVASEPRNPIPFNGPGFFNCQPGTCMVVFNGTYGLLSAQGHDLSLINSSVTESLGIDFPDVDIYSFCGVGHFGGNNLSCSISESPDFASQIIENGAQGVGQNSTNVEESSRNIYDSSKLFAASQFGALQFTHDRSSQSKGDSYSSLAVENCLSFVENNSISFFEPSFCDSYAGVGYVVNYNFTALHSALVYQTLADEALMREALLGGDQNVAGGEYSISATIHPLPITKVEEDLGAAEDAFMAWFLVVLSFPFISGTFATFIVAEKSSKAKHLQTVAGVQPTAYWLSTYFWDIMNYQLPLWITIAFMFIFGVDALTTTERGVVGGVIVTLVLFGPASAGFTYCISHLFDSPSLCNLIVIIFNFLIGLAGPIVAFILRLLGDPNGLDNPNLILGADVMEWVLRFIPSFNLGSSLNKIINIQTYEYLAGEPITVWDDTAILYEVIFQAIWCFAYIILAIRIDIWSNNPRIVSIWQSFLRFMTCRFSNRLKATELLDDAVIDDEDVVEENERVSSGGANSDLIVLDELSKVYDNGKVAVNHLSLGIPPGQCFGLLGINGAGKTTTMGMLTAEFPPTAGDATLAGFSVTREPEKTRRRVGYCPQFDAHFQNMTGREHIALYANIKGVPKEFVDEAVSQKLAEVGLSEDDSDRLSQGYSGGMKRKLSVACATIGQPQIVFLDEPSTGMDPVARRDLWAVISEMVTGGNIPDEERTSVILTTHSMEECEALCPRIGIMANGKLRCLGSAQRLKSRFGQGYQVEIKVEHVENHDEDYGNVAMKLAELAGKQPSNVSNAPDEEGAQEQFYNDVFLSYDECLEALSGLTGDTSLADKVNPDDPTGYTVYKNAKTPVGCTLEEVATFAAGELRMTALDAFFSGNFDAYVLRERQDTKARYEIGSAGVRISNIFNKIEENSEQLKISDYGVSQTSLEQVFNMHAAEAERLKQGRNDG